MMKRIDSKHHEAGTPRRAVVAVAMVAVLLIIDLAVVGIVVGLSRDHDLTLRRMQTIEAEYAAEAGMNMAIREAMNDADEDGDTKIGGISDDGDSGTDPSIGNASFWVDYDDSDPSYPVLTSEGRSGDARRQAQATLQAP
jgi:hypothetical protein